MACGGEDSPFAVPVTKPVDVTKSDTTKTKPDTTIIKPDTTSTKNDSVEAGGMNVDITHWGNSGEDNGGVAE